MSNLKKLVLPTVFVLIGAFIGAILFAIGTLVVWSIFGDADIRIAALESFIGVLSLLLLGWLAFSANQVAQRSAREQEARGQQQNVRYAIEFLSQFKSHLGPERRKMATKIRAENDELKKLLNVKVPSDFSKALAVLQKPSKDAEEPIPQPEARSVSVEDAVHAIKTIRPIAEYLSEDLRFLQDVSQMIDNKSIPTEIAGRWIKASSFEENHKLINKSRICDLDVVAFILEEDLERYRKLIQDIAKME